MKAQARIADAQHSLDSDTELLGTLAQRMGKATEPEKPDLQDQLDLVGSRIEIEKDEIEEANDDLMAAGGNVHQRSRTPKKNTSPPSVIPRLRLPSPRPVPYRPSTAWLRRCANGWACVTSERH